MNEFLVNWRKSDRGPEAYETAVREADERVRRMTRERSAHDGYIAMLEDAVVAAACVVFDQVPSKSEESYLTENLHEMALDICRRTPRLRDAFKDLT